MKNKNPIRSFKRSNTETPQTLLKTNQLQKNQMMDQSKNIQPKKSSNQFQKIENKPVIITNTRNKSEKNILKTQNEISQNQNNNNDSIRRNSIKNSIIIESELNKERNKNIKVYARFRPLNDMEISLLNNNIGWITPEYQNDNIIIMKNRNYNITNDNVPTFKFDKVFKETTPQIEIYENIGKEIVKDVMDGYNGTIFAYGQSGSGKTYTMYGSNIYDDDFKGVIPRIIYDIFNYVELADENISFQFKLSVVQIYKEVIYDLLTGEKNLVIKESPSRGIFIDNLSEVYLSSIDDFLYYAEIAESNRKVGETKLNQNSSRSHSIMIIEVTQQFKKENIIKKGILNLVDLAGCEKVSKTGAVGETLEEAKKINLSLSALGNVIHALTSHSDHIPYRDSKLTRILQESLGGNYKTSLIVTCSPHSYNLDECISSLQFAQRAKTIKNKVKINIKYSYEELQQMVYKLNKKLEIANQKILRLRNGEKNENSDNFNFEIGDCVNCGVMREEKNLLEGKIEELNNEIKEKDDEIKKLKSKNQSFISRDSNNEDKISKVKNLYEEIKSSLDNIQKENKKISWDNISNNLILQNENFNKLISNYVKNSNKNEFFDEINKMLLNNIKIKNDTNYNKIYDEYVNNLNDIFSKIEDNKKKVTSNDLLKIFSTNFFYEYLHYYFSYQLLNQAYEKMKSDNESLNNINNELTSLIENILSLNYEIANNNLINENAINLLKTFNNQEIQTKQNKNYNSMIHSDNHNLNLTSSRMSVTFGNDISQKFIKIVSKKNLSLKGKQNRKCNAIVTLNNQINNNIINNNDNIIDENIERIGEVYFSDDINNKIENYNNIDITKSKFINYSKTIPNDEFEVIENKKIISETKESQSHLKMIKQVFVSNIKKNEDLIQEIENMKKDFDNVINYNSNYFTNLILNKNNNLNNKIYDSNLIIEENESDENSPKNTNRINKFRLENYNNKNSLLNNDNKNNKKDSNNIINNLKNKEETIISSKIKNIKNNNNNKILLNSQLSNESNSDIKSKENENSNTENNDYDNDLTPKSENIQNYTYIPQTKEFFNKKAYINKKINITKDNNNQILKSIKNDNNIINNNNSNNFTKNSEQNSISINTFAGENNHSKAFSNLFYENSNLNIITKNKKINNDKIIPLLNKEDKIKNHLEKSIEKYLETGTASRRFDGIKVNFNNGIINYEYASGLSAKQKLINNPLQNQKIKKLNGDDDTPFI